MEIAFRLCSMCIGLLLAFSSELYAIQLPNIILIFADDLGWQECGFSGSDFNETPQLDQLSREGMVFTQAYAGAGNCAPSRACLLSGRYSPRHGVYAVGTTKRGPVDLMRLEPVKNNSGLGRDEFTLPKAMKSAGYVTGMFGKWHLDGKPGSHPREHFDVVKIDGHGWQKEDEKDPKGIMSITSAACDFIDANRNQPFFLYVPHYAIHSPLQSRKEVLESFKQKQPGKLHKDAKNAACLADLDTGIGVLLKKLRDLKLEENTLVVFTSDNGGTVESQEPLRGKKGCYYEGGIRVPMIVRWPAVVKPGTQCDVPVVNVDLYATFAALAAAKLPPERSLDGANLMPLFQGQDRLDRQAIYWHFPGYLDNPVPRGRDPKFRTRPVSVVRKGDWKLHLYHEEWLLDGGRKHLATNNAVELYNIVNDPGEANNRASTDFGKRDELLDDLLAWFKRVHARLPSEPPPELALQPATVLVNPWTNHIPPTKRQGVPGIERTAQGRLWVVYGRDVESTRNYQVLKMSDDDGKSWSDVKLMIMPQQNMRAMSPSIWIDPQQRLWLFWGQSAGLQDSRYGIWAISTDEPDTETPRWSAPRRIGDGIMLNKPTVLANGDWLLTSSVWKTDNSIKVYASNDEGETFSLRGTANIEDEKTRGPDEPMIVERKDGSLWMMVRCQGLAESVSHDQGRTWSPVHRIALPHPTSRFFLRRLSSGALLLVKHGPLDKRTKREQLTAYVSDDDGQTWQGGLVLDEREDVTYPDGLQAADGVIYIAYDHQRTPLGEILMATFTEQDVRAGKQVSNKVRFQKIISRLPLASP